jgi:hypothetical protein
MAQNPVAGASPDTSHGLGRPFSGVMGQFVEGAFLDAAGKRQQVDTITVGAATNDGVYTLRIQSTTSGISFDSSYSFTADGAATVAEVRDGIVAVLRADSALGILISDIDDSGAGVAVLTGAAQRTFSLSFTANPGTDLVNASVAPGFTQYTYGQAVQLVAAPSGIPSQLSARGVQNPVLPTLGALVLSIDTNANSTTCVVLVTHTYSDGTATAVDSVGFAGGANTAATAALAEAAFLSAYPQSTQGTVGSDVTITLPAGEALSVISITNSGALVVSGVTSAAGALPELAIVVDAGNVAPNSTAGPTSVTGPTPGTAVSCAKSSGGNVQWVIPTTGATLSGAKLYVDTSGALSSSKAITRMPFNGPVFRSIINSTQDALEY